MKEEVRMKANENYRWITDRPSKKGILDAIALGLIILLFPLVCLSAESTQVIPVAIPLVMTSPLLPTQVLLVNSPVVKGETVVIIGWGSDGAAFILRLSAGD